MYGVLSAIQDIGIEQPGIGELGGTEISILVASGLIVLMYLYSRYNRRNNKPKLVLQLMLLPVIYNDQFIRFTVIDIKDPTGTNLKLLYECNSDIIKYHATRASRRAWVFYENNQISLYPIHEYNITVDRIRLSMVHPNVDIIGFIQNDDIISHSFPSPDRSHFLRLSKLYDITICTGIGPNLEYVDPTEANRIWIKTNWSIYLALYS